MKIFRVVCVFCFVSFLSVCRSELPSSCLSDLVSSSSGRCCSPQTFISIEFTLGFGCDVPIHLDQGVRFEVEIGRQEWKPIRFYTPTLNQSEFSLIRLLTPDPPVQFVHAQAYQDNSTFPLHYINSTSGPVQIREYLCGKEFANSYVRLRWMQRYMPPSNDNVSTWWLDDIRISRWDGMQLSTVMESDFSDGIINNFNILSGVVEKPDCATNSALYFREASTRGVPRRSLVISHFSLNCSEGPCQNPVALPQDSECGVTSCGPTEMKCSLPMFAPVECTVCPPGYTTENATHAVACLDVDECELMMHHCKGVARCMNTIGSFLCYCPPGYSLTNDNSCSDINECIESHNCSHECINTDGGFNCSCPDGYLIVENTICATARVGFESTAYTVMEGGNVTLELSLLDNITQPLTIQVRTEDDTASGDDYVIDPVLQTITFLPGGPTTALITVHALEDDYAEHMEGLRVVLSHPSLGLMIIEGKATVDIIDTNEVLVEFDPVSYDVIEGEHVAFRIVKRTNSTREVSIFFNATMRVPVTFLPEEMVQFVNITTTDDVIYEGDELLVAVLEAGNSGVRLGNYTATATILDNDVVTFGFNPTEYEVVEGVTVMATVELIGETSIDVVVNVATQDQTASAAEGDYTMLNESLTFTSATKRQYVFVHTIDDDNYEEDEVFQVILSVPKFGSDEVNINQTATITVLNDDVMPTGLEPATLDFDQPVYNVSEDSGPFVVCVLVTEGQLEEQVEFTLTSIDGSATAGTDYHAVSINLTLVPGDSTKTCTNITLINDGDREGGSPEYFQLLLQTPQKTSGGQQIPVKNHVVRVAIFDDEEVIALVSDLLSLPPSNASDRLTSFIDFLIESGRKVSPEISKQLLGASQNLLQNSSDMKVGSRVLGALDRFALRAYDEKKQPELKLDGLSLRVQELQSPINKPMVLGIDQNGTTIQLPQEAFERAGQTVRVASFVFMNLTSALPSESRDVNDTSIASPVISTVLGCGRRGSDCPEQVTRGFTQQNVRIVLPLTTMNNSKIETCQFLDLEENIWSDNGCHKLDESNETTIVCECNHLTHFAILLSPNLNVSEEHVVALQVIGYVGVSISIVCMIITIVALVALRSLWGMRNYIHINLCICLIVAQLVFVIAVDKTENQKACTAIAVILHYCFLTTFMWMLMEGVVLYVALVRVFIKKQTLYIAGFTIISYGVPLLYMLITVPLGVVLPDKERNHYGSAQACWLRYDTHFIWAFIIPVILIILANIGFFIMAVYIMYKHQRRGVHKSVVKQVKHWLKISIALLFVMGITWIIGVLVFHEALLFVAYIFTIFVAFQGTIIFIMFIVLSKQVRESYKKWWRGKVAESDILSKYFSFSESSGSKGLGRFSSLQTSSFRLSRHRSTFHSTNIDTDIKLPDDNAESLRDVISPELRMNKYMMEQKYELGTSIAETSDFHSTEPNEKVALGESLAETSEYIQQNGMITLTAVVNGCEDDGCHQRQVDMCHHLMTTTQDVPTTNSSQETSVTEDHPTQDSSSEQRHLSPDTHQCECRQESDQDTAL